MKGPTCTSVLHRLSPLPGTYLWLSALLLLPLTLSVCKTYEHTFVYVRIDASLSHQPVLAFQVEDLMDAG